MVDRAVEGVDQGRIAPAKAGVSTVKGCAQAHVDDVRMDKGTGSVFKASDYRGERSAAGIAQHFYHHQLGIGSYSLRADAIDRSGHDATHMSGVAERAVRGENEAGLGRHKRSAQTQVEVDGNIDMASHYAGIKDSDPRASGGISPVAVGGRLVGVNLVEVPLYRAEALVIGKGQSGGVRRRHGGIIDGVVRRNCHFVG